MFDYLIVGSGFSGCVLAERLANAANKRVLVIDKRNHIGGNSYDYYNNDGILVHKYGPHYFRTNMKHVFDYLSKFTEWNYNYYRIKVSVDGMLLPLPINLDTVNSLYNFNFTTPQLEEYFKKVQIDMPDIKNSEEVIISKVGSELYEKFYKFYTLKQWGLEPSHLDSSVCARIPVRTNRDDRYFTDKYQAMPKSGYFKMFQNMLRSPNINIMLQTEYNQLIGNIKTDKIIYTGLIDEFFDYKYGRLPYRSLRFEHETFNKEYYQSVSQVNYPYDYDFTRIVEIKHATGQIHPCTTIVREYSTPDGEPYYPIPNSSNHEMYLKYYEEAAKIKNVFFIGRLAEYKYLNMDQVVNNALNLFESRLI